MASKSSAKFASNFTRAELNERNRVLFVHGVTPHEAEKIDDIQVMVFPAKRLDDVTEPGDSITGLSSRAAEPTAESWTAQFENPPDWCTIRAEVIFVGLVVGTVGPEHMTWSGRLEILGT